MPSGALHLYLAGPTASGKSDVALELALALGGEILTADSMQVYRGLDLGTAKPSAADRARVPHHLLDLAGPDESFDAAQWLAAARRVEADVLGRGRVPVFCGGTGFYLRAWFTGLDSPPPPDPMVRAELESTPLDRLLAELAAADPAAFGAVDRSNPRRVRRAVERLRVAGPGGAAVRPSSAVPPEGDRVWVLRRGPADLRRRIETRVDAMFAAGLVEETRRLLPVGLERNRTAMQAIGYRQVVEHLRGERDLASTVALVKSRTWQFARRQMTWFRHQLAGEWVDVPEGESAFVTAARLRASLESAGA